MKSEDAIFLLKLIAAEAGDYSPSTPEIDQRARDALAEVCDGAISELKLHEGDHGGHRSYECLVCTVRKDMS